MKKRGLTVREFMGFSLAFCNKLDANGDLKDTKMNRLLYKAFCKLAGGEDKRDEFCQQIMDKVEQLGIDTKDV